MSIASNHMRIANLIEKPKTNNTISKSLNQYYNKEKGSTLIYTYTNLQNIQKAISIIQKHLSKFGRLKHFL